MVLIGITALLVSRGKNQWLTLLFRIWCILQGCRAVEIVFLNLGYLGFLKKPLKPSKTQFSFFRFLFLMCNLINKPHIQNKYNCCLSVSYIILYTQLK